MSDSSRNPNAKPIEMRGVAVPSTRDVETVMVEDVNWSVAAGDFWVLGGLQGSGKSDFLMLTAGLTAPARGTYLFFGEPMPLFEEHRLPQRLRLGLVFDGGQLFNHLTVSENISLPICYHHNLTKPEAEPHVRRLLDLCELGPWADSTPGALARNWQKRVGMARALALKPDVLLLDNPLAGLDLRHRAWWLNLLGQLSRGHEWMEGRAVTLVVTADDLRPWQKAARQFAVLKNRGLAALGGWQQVSATADELVRELLAMAAE